MHTLPWHERQNNVKSMSGTKQPRPRDVMAPKTVFGRWSELKCTVIQLLQLVDSALKLAIIKAICLHFRLNCGVQ